MAADKNAIIKTERLLAVIISLSLVFGAAAGLFMNHTGISDTLEKALPDAQQFESGPDDIYTGFTDVQGDKITVGYVAVRSARGYAGPVTAAVGMDKDGTIVNALIVRQTESLAFFRRVTDAGYPGWYTGKNCTDQFKVGTDVDSVTGATVSLEALSNSVRIACSDIASERLGMPVTPTVKPSVRFGLPEIVLVLLIIASFSTTTNKYLKWVIMVGSIVFIGFVFKWPATLISINSLLIGYFPAWQNHIYWYILVAAILLPVIVNGKTPYCRCVCPFGATQEILLKIGGTKRQLQGKWLRVFRLLQRVLAWTAIMCALIFRNPTLVSYEVSTTLFTIIGQNWQFVLLAVFLILSLFITRPWCNCLCPLRAVFDYVRLIRRSFSRKPDNQ